MNGKKPEIAFLVYSPEKKRRKNNSFDGNDNIGANVIKEILENSGHMVGFCEASTANKYKVVLVSLTSTYDVYAFYKAVAMRPEWQLGKRKFAVVAGGFGMQNPHTIRDYVDYAVFGRAENFVSDLVGSVIGGGIFDHESVMRLPDIYRVKIAQAKKLYEGDVFKESFIGCPNKCKFCHYSWARKSTGNNGEYVQGSLTKGASPEVLFKDLVSTKQKKGRIRTAIDGFSENIRCVYGKKITNEMIKNGLEHVGSFGGNTVMIIYNIGNFPCESDEDRKELYCLMDSINPKSRVIAIFHTTALRPSLATPMQYAPVSLYPSYSKERFKAIVDKPNFTAKHSMSNESPFSQLSSVVAERATFETDKLFKTICFSKKLKSKNSYQKIKALQANFDLEPYLKRYDPDEEKYPGWWIESYMPKDATKKAFLWTERQFL